MRAAVLVPVATVIAVEATTYDYVVVGGGTAGLTVASRLTEDPHVTVAVLEAGFDAEGYQEVFIPGLAGTGIGATLLDWAYETVPQTNLGGRTIKISAGKGLGGSTLINSMVFPRAESKQYDVWGQLNNDSTWTWDGLLPYFKKSEIFTPPNNFQTAAGVVYLEDVHGFDGKVKVGFPNYFFEQSALWRAAAEILGIPASLDLANGDPHSVGISPNSIDAANNTRCSSACAHYTPFADRPNFVVLTNVTASRILWANSSTTGVLTASGVEYITADNQTLSVSVSQEVLLAAGAIGSPKVLELSGVGNSTILTTAGVTPVLNLPTVGENLADHCKSWANAFTNISMTLDVLSVNTEFAAQQLTLWYANRTGMYSAIPRSLSIAAPSDIWAGEEDQLSDLIAQAEGNISLYAAQFSNGNADLAQGIAAQHGIALKLYKQNLQLPLEMNAQPGYSGPTPAADRPAANYTTVGSVLYAPLSRGRTHIASSNPTVYPQTDPAYWSHPLDIAAHVGGIRLARKMLVAPPLNSIYQGEFQPGTENDTDELVEAWLRSVVDSDNHIMGGLSMMPQNLGGVVDTRLKVYGTANVRAVDASIIPFPVSAHLSSTVYAIAELAADIIRGVNSGQ